MKIEINDQKKNPLMNRDEYMISLDHAGKPTPSRQEILKEIASEVKAKEDVIIIDKIFNKAGISASDVVVFVYNKEDEIPKDKLEKMTKRMKKKEKGEEATPISAEAPKESGEEAKPDETSKEIPKAEEEAKSEEPKESAEKVEEEVKKEEEAPAEEKKEEDKV